MTVIESAAASEVLSQSFIKYKKADCPNDDSEDKTYIDVWELYRRL